MARARTIHTIAASTEGAAAVEVDVASNAPIGDVIEALGRVLGWPTDELRLATPNLAVYGRPTLMSELGFERRTQDQRRHTVAEVLPDAGATARLTADERAADLVVATVAVAVDPSESAATPGGAPEHSGAVQDSEGATTELDDPDGP